jgi:glycosyltransferase involved in cell wall biosynthesis
MRKAVNDWVERYAEPFVMYFHVWEIDTEQPRINAASKFNQIRHYRKLDKMEWIIKENLQKYDFTTISEFLGLEVESRESKVESPIEVKSIQNPKSKIQNQSVSVVIPCYNEESALPYLANTLRNVETELNETGYQPNFIFVDDCSKDNTFNVLQELFGKKDNVQIIKHKHNQGVAAGILTGLKASETEIVCSMDCDCTYDPHELVNMIPLLTDEIDMVTASPYHKKGSVRNVPEWRLFLSKGASFLYRRTLNAKISTFTSCFRIYRRSSVIDLNIKEKGFLGVAEMLGKLDLSGGKIIEYPATLEVRLFGFSKMKTARTIFGHLKLLSNLSKQRFFGKSEKIKPVLTKIESESVKK